MVNLGLMMMTTTTHALTASRAVLGNQHLSATSAWLWMSVGKHPVAGKVLSENP